MSRTRCGRPREGACAREYDRRGATDRAVPRGEGRGRRAPVALLAAVAALTLAATPALSQMVGPRDASRAQLEAMMDSLRQAHASATDGDRREELQNEIDGLSYRLEHGDVWPGDVIDLQVQGEERWSDTFTVSPQRTLELPAIDPISLEGVLYSSVEERIAEQLSTYLREPRLTVNVLKRVGVLGAVGSPGFYLMRGNTLVSEAIMRAGGPAQDADVDDVEVRSSGRKLSEGRPRVAFQTISLDQLGVRSGDDIYVPQEGQGLSAWKLITGALGFAGSIAFLIHRL